MGTRAAPELGCIKRWEGVLVIERKPWLSHKKIADMAREALEGLGDTDEDDMKFLERFAILIVEGEREDLLVYIQELAKEIEKEKVNHD